MTDQKLMHMSASIHTIELIRAAGVYCEQLETREYSDGRINRHDVLIPEWVIAAVEAYSKNDGYADLDPVEYLRKLNNG